MAKLEGVLKEIGIWAISAGIGLSVPVGFYLGIGFGLKIYDNHIQKKLEPYAINCKGKNNILFFPDWKINLPKIENKDLDGNGKYESIIVYLNGDGKKYCQEIRKTDGKLVFMEPKLYE